MTVSGIEANIANLLMGALEAQTYNDDTGTPLTYAWPEVEFDPSSTPKYIAAAILYNKPTFVGVNAGAVKSGLFQVTVFWPKNQGEIKPLEVASAIAAAWAIGTALFSTGLKVKVDKPPYLSGPISDQSRVSVPVTIPWAAFAA